VAPPLLTLKDIHLSFGSLPLLSGAELTITHGDRICLVGRNGSGKSSLLRIAAGLIEPDKGERFAHPGARICYLPQEPDPAGYTSVLSYATAALGPTDDPFSVRYLLSTLGFTGDENPATLSGGELKRAALIRVIAAKPDVLILDEPTNHLDLPAIEWLEGELNAAKGAVVVVSHDRRFLERVSRSVVWIDRGRARLLDQSFSAFEAWRDCVLEQEELESHKLDRKIAREDQWMHGGVTARRKRNVRRVAALQVMRKARREHRSVQGNVRLAAAEGGLSSKLIVEAANITKSFDGTPIVHGFSTRIMRGDRVGIVGPNGVGKTTLLKLLTGSLLPDAGSVRLGENLALVSLDQRRDELKPDWTIADALTGGRGDQVVINGRPRHVSSYMKDFLFPPEQSRSPLSVLSGGERGRLMLARALARPSNLLVLDEPTNDLDLETLDLLQELLSDYSGTVLLVCHDRDFLDRIVTSVIAAEGDGRWVEYAGGYSDMLAQRKGEELSKKGPQEAKPESKTAEPLQKQVWEPPSERKRKLSFKEKHALETLPSTMEALTREIGVLETKLAAADFFVRDPSGFATATSRLAQLQADLRSAEEQWLELELLRTELEG
jgi:ATP-binding cassette subfamily F protein uup